MVDLVRLQKRGDKLRLRYQSTPPPLVERTTTTTPLAESNAMPLGVLNIAAVPTPLASPDVLFWPASVAVCALTKPTPPRETRTVTNWRVERRDRSIIVYFRWIMRQRRNEKCTVHYTLLQPPLCRILKKRPPSRRHKQHMKKLK